MSQTIQAGASQPLDFLYRHKSALIWLAVLAFVVWMQWPMIKGTFYKYSGRPAPADGIAWRTVFEQALAESSETGKPVLLDFSASWCPPCQVMKHEVWPNEQVRQTVMEGYIPVLLDVDAAASRAIAQRYEVTGVPTILVVAADGRVLRQSGYMSRSAALAFLKPPA